MGFLNVLKENMETRETFCWEKGKNWNFRPHRPTRGSMKLFRVWISYYVVVECGWAMKKVWRFTENFPLFHQILIHKVSQVSNFHEMSWSSKNVSSIRRRQNSRLTIFCDKLFSTRRLNSLRRDVKCRSSISFDIFTFSQSAQELQSNFIFHHIKC